MAFAEYSATNGNVTVTRNLIANRDYVIFNNTMCAFNCVLNNTGTNGNDQTFLLEPGEGRTYHSDTAATNATLVCTPVHTAANASVEFPLQGQDGGVNTTVSGARVTWNDFAG